MTQGTAATRQTIRKVNLEKILAFLESGPKTTEEVRVCLICEYPQVLVYLKDLLRSKHIQRSTTRKTNVNQSHGHYRYRLHPDSKKGGALPDSAPRVRNAVD